MTGEATHLVVLIHGLFGSTSNLEVLAEELISVANSESPSSSGWTEAVEHAGDMDKAAASPSLGGADTINAREPPITPRRSARTRARITELSNGAEEVIVPASPTRSGTGIGKVVVYNCNSFGWGHTWDGVDVNAERAADEVRKEITRLEEEGQEVKWISFIGYSLGGLIARYLIAALNATDPAFFTRHRPAAFATVATPHLGVLKYGTTTNTIIHTIGRRLFSRTGQQLYCMDKDAEGRCLLEVMADPEAIFIRTLQRFNKVYIFVNGCNDLTVPFPTAAISNTDPFADHEAHPFPMTVDDDHIVRSWIPSLAAGAEENEEVIQCDHGVGESSLSGTTPVTEPLDASVPQADNSGTEGSQREEINIKDGDIDVKVMITRRTKDVRAQTERSGQKIQKSKAKRPRYPPVLFARYPYTYLPILLLPVIFPLWICFVTCFMIYQSFKSARRYRLHTTSRLQSERTPLLSTANGISTASPPTHLAHPHPVPQRAHLSASTPAPPSGTSTPPFQALAMSPSVSLPGKGKNRQVEDEEVQELLPKPSAPLMLTQRQRDMIENFNSALEGKVERVIAWFPLEFNAHATLIVRNPKVFPNHNQARGILRLLSSKVLAAAT